jgi:hypothetical protein
MRLDELKDVLGGDLREGGDRTWLETRVGGLRAFVICRRVGERDEMFDLAVFTPEARCADPFDSRQGFHDWLLENEHVMPRLTHGFLFSGCRDGILFASSGGQPTPENISSALSELAEWAHKPWHPGFRARGFTTRPRTREQLRRARLQQVGIACVVFLAVVNAMTLRSWLVATILIALVLTVLRRLDVAEPLR